MSSSYLLCKKKLCKACMTHFKNLFTSYFEISYAVSEKLFLHGKDYKKNN